MPATHVALLRGINVGRAKRVAMADLRAIAAELGYAHPRTLLNSGNLVFSSPVHGEGDREPKVGAGQAVEGARLAPSPPKRSPNACNPRFSPAPASQRACSS